MSIIQGTSTLVKLKIADPRIVDGTAFEGGQDAAVTHGILTMPGMHSIVGQPLISDPMQSVQLDFDPHTTFITMHHLSRHQPGLGGLQNRLKLLYNRLIGTQNQGFAGRKPR